MATHRKGPAEHRYVVVQVRVWGDEKTTSEGLPPPHPMTLWLYLLTSPFSLRVPGVIVAGRAALAEALDWSPEDFDTCFSPWASKGMVIADWKARLVYLTGSFRQPENRPASPSTAATWRRDLLSAPECALRERVIGDLRQMLKELHPSFLRSFDLGRRSEFPRKQPAPLPAGQPGKQASEHLAPAPAPALAPAPAPKEEKEESGAPAPAPSLVRRPVQQTIADLVDPSPPTRKAKGPEVLPDWLPVESWEAWKADRAERKKPMTGRAERLAIAELDRHRAKGYSPKQVIDNAILHGWQGLYEPKESPWGSGVGGQVGAAQSGLSAIEAQERAALEKRRRDAAGAGRPDNSRSEHGSEPGPS